VIAKHQLEESQHWAASTKQQNGEGKALTRHVNKTSKHQSENRQ
jgi:hypothetical protein